MSNIKEELTTFDDYWLGYLSAHQKPATRFLHYFGTVFGLFVGVGAAVLIKWWLFFVCASIGYGIAFLSHPLIEGNYPFAHRPLWSMASDLKMLWFATVGGLKC